MRLYCNPCSLDESRMLSHMFSESQVTATREVLVQSGTCSAHGTQYCILATTCIVQSPLCFHLDSTGVSSEATNSTALINPYP